MTFRPLDLQIAIPRTQELGNMQQQAAQRPVTEQNILEQGAAKQIEEMRKQNAAVEGSSKPRVQTNGEEGKGGTYGKGSKKKRPVSADGGEGEGEPAHPYKGRSIDIRL
jgi:hypothetical protein